MSKSVDIDITFPDWQGTLQKHEKDINLFIAANVQYNRGMLFDSEGAYNGRPRWQDLVFRNGMILSKRGTLRKSIAPFNPKGYPGPDGIVRFSGDVITVGTKLLYARMMNDGTTKMPGGVLRPVRAKALKIPIPQGKQAAEGAKDIQGMHQQKQLNKLNKEYRSVRSERWTKTNLAKQHSLIKKISRTAEKMGKGEGPVKFIFRKWVKIPARPFDTWNDQDQKELDAALMNKITQILNKAAQ